jgi:hypothetical protein
MNRTESSQAMEADVIVEFFLQRKHGLRYTRLIGDGDSSVLREFRKRCRFGV